MKLSEANGLLLPRNGSATVQESHCVLGDAQPSNQTDKLQKSKFSGIKLKKKMAENCFSKYPSIHIHHVCNTESHCRSKQTQGQFKN
jgi:hypothetical protein